jgi:hypothetical protein
LRGDALTAGLQQPGVERGRAGGLAMRAGGMRDERQRAPVLSVLHVGADQAHLAVGGMADQRGTLERAERARDVALGQRGFALRQQLRVLAQPCRLGCCGIGRRHSWRPPP